jgi:leucyl-tRNA synthetase
MSTGKRDALKGVEARVQERWKVDGAFMATPLEGSPKFFATFPYPYMNGVMHLGHAYTVSKLDFYCRFMRQQGYNVLFPFGWHGTGMPIVACANRLKDALANIEDLTPATINALSDKNQIKILYKMGIPIDEISKFTDPYYWISYFPKIARTDLTDLGVSADFTREFVTTDINPYYDSFIKWQFELLRRYGMVKFGKKFIIFSPKDGQPCADHDRSVGEGVEVKEFICLEFRLIDDSCTLLVATTDPRPFVDTKKLFIGKDESYTIFLRDGVKYVSSAETYRNLQYQSDSKFETIDTVKGSNFVGNKVHNIPVFGSDELEIVGIPDVSKISSGIGLAAKTPSIDNASYAEFKDKIISGKFGFIYCEPASEVISRTGDRCVVCLTDQWFINYNQEELKRTVNDHIMHGMELYDHGVKEQLLESSRWITDWPCSRSVGLGTKLFDTGLLIDSLSDSTIYMAFYTISHLINKIPVNKIKFDFWEYIFRDGAEPSDFDDGEMELIRNMRHEFRYWYPFDMRVSGKDLIGNHLTMCLYNHAAVWGPTMLPRAYAVNGHALLNGKKMAKSDGNFMTLRDAIDRYGADATRLALATSCGTEGIDDANFTDANANEAILKLTTEMEFCKELIYNILKSSSDEPTHTFWDIVFENEINRCIMETTEQMEKMNSQKVIFHGFYGLLTARDNYRSMYKNKFISPNYRLLHRYLMAHLSLINPVCPHYATDIWNYGKDKGLFGDMTWPSYDPPSNKIVYLNYCIDTFLNNVRTQFAKMMKLKPGSTNMTLNVVIYSSYSDKEMTIIRSYKDLMDQNVDPKQIVGRIIESAADKKDRGLYGRFGNYIKVNVLRFGLEWLNIIIQESEDEYNLIKEWAPILLADIIKKVPNVSIIIKKGDEQSMVNDQGPGKPYVKIDK